MRLDQELVNRGIYPTRAKAVAGIKSGLVRVNGVVASKASQNVSDKDNVVGISLPYVSGRGSLKLKHALEFFNVNPNGYVCLDVGASTGGFTEVLLKRGAKKVIAVDVGTGQLVPELYNNPKVVALEKTDIRKLVPFEKIDLVVVDVSFISLVNIAESLLRWGADKMILLVKPQFEVDRAIAAKNNGVIKSESDRRQSVDKVRNCFEKLGLVCGGVIESPVRGGSGNIEFLMYLEKDK